MSHLSLEGIGKKVREDAGLGRQGHGSNSQLGRSRFDLAKGRANDADTSGHKASGKNHRCVKLPRMSGRLIDDPESCRWSLGVCDV